MFAFNTLQKTLTPFVVDNVPQECIDSVKKIADKHKHVLTYIHKFYHTCGTHIEFLQTTIVSVQKTLQKYGVEYSQIGIEQARTRLVPVLERFGEQKEKTDQLAHAILYLIMEYINDSPWNQGLSLQTAPTIAVLSINVFIVGFASSLVALAGIQQTLLGEEQPKDKH
tara:strand:- start:352 stop:855 length:504 start_codon:yes stop_codon:yes gene_type:complete